jgi:5'-deoxynucleotidase YfbR-like HD superfamily hydrolase
MDDFDAMTGRGFKIWFLRPELTPIDLEDIKYAANNICRYNGHCTWSLLQHLTLCTLLAQYHLSNDYARFPNKDSVPESVEYLVAQCACHDMHEIYVGDVITGLKKYLTEFKQIELLWETYVLSTFGLDLPMGATKWFVKYIDNRALTLEMTGARHLSAGRVTELFGQPEEAETEIYEFVRELDPHACWFIITKAIEAYQEGEEYGEDRVKQPNGIS